MLTQATRRHLFPFATLFLGIIATVGCDVVEPDADAPAGPLDGSPEAEGLLSFLDDPGTTVELLDETVGLDLRAAGHLILHRDGADGEYGTADDDPFDTVTEIDEVPYVGPRTMERLMAWVVTAGWVPEVDPFLGAWDGIAFTQGEAARTLAAANLAAEHELDHGAELNLNAVHSIVNARPLSGIEALAALKYVGPATLGRLKTWALVHGPMATSEHVPACPIAPLMTPGELQGATHWEPASFTVCDAEATGVCPSAQDVDAAWLIARVAGAGPACAWQASAQCGPFALGDAGCCYVVRLDSACGTP